MEKWKRDVSICGRAFSCMCFCMCMLLLAVVFFSSSYLQIIQNTNRFWAFAQCAAPKPSKASKRFSWILLQLILHIVRPAHRNRLHVTPPFTVHMDCRPSEKRIHIFFPVRFSIIVCCTMFCFFHLSIRFHDDVEFCLWYDTWRRECENREKPGEEMVQFCRWYCFSYCQLLVRCGCDCDCVYMFGSVCDTPNVYTHHPWLICLLSTWQPAVVVVIAAAAPF